MVILIVMNSLLSNLGPRYSRRNSTTPIVLGFLLLIIAIAVATYFLTRDDEDDEDDDDGKDKKDENVPSIEDPTVTRTFLPDSSNSSESGTTETYEIGGGKTETYQVEYNNPITDITLSKNVKIGITWSNRSGFENVYKLDIEHYVTPNNQDGSAGTLADDASFTKTITRYNNGAKSGTKIADNENYFKNYAEDLTHEFQGDGTYSFVGTHTVKIIATYPDEDIEGADIDLDLTTGTATTTPVVVTSEDLAATLDLTSPVVKVYTPIQGSFNLGQAVIQNQEYFASTGGVDIHKSINVNNNSSRPFTLIRASTTNSNEFYFKFSETEYLGHVDGALVIDTADSKKIITLVSSSLDDTGGVRYFRLSFVNDLYAIIDEDGNGAVKAMADIEKEDVYDTLDWKLSLEPAAAAAAAAAPTAADGFNYTGSFTPVAFGKWNLTITGFDTKASRIFYLKEEGTQASIGSLTFNAYTESTKQSKILTFTPNSTKKYLVTYAGYTDPFVLVTISWDANGIPQIT